MFSFADYNESKIDLDIFSEILTIHDKSYQVGGKRKKHNKDKTANDDYYYLTLASIAKEIQSRGLNTDIEVLPLMDYKRNSADFIRYRQRDNAPVYFDFNNIHYRIHIRKVDCYVQGFSAICNEWIEERLDDEEPLIWLRVRHKPIP